MFRLPFWVKLDVLFYHKIDICDCRCEEAVVQKLFDFIIFSAEKNSTDTSYEVLCGTLSKLTEVDNLTLQKWLSKMIVSSQVCL